MLRRPQGAIVAAIAAMSALMFAAGCTSTEATFCAELEDRVDLGELVNAIELEDTKRISDGLDDLRVLEDTAPEEVFDEVRALIDVVSNLVRVTTGVDEGSGSAPLDAAELNAALAEVAEPAQVLAEYADRTCGITLP